MEIEDLIDRFRLLPAKTRYALVVVIALLPALYYWLEQGDTLQRELERARQEEAAVRGRLESAKRKVAELPALLTQVESIEADLQRAKKILPDKVEMDQVLASLGNFEKDLDIKMYKFAPGNEVQPNPQIDYKEIPVELTVRASFQQIMRFYDRVLHMPNLTHLRAIQFSSVDDDGDDEDGGQRAPIVESTSKLILFKGL
jgi:Tfp pilus assembly protein PilO